MWEVETGRKDGFVSLASNVNGNLPSPFSDFATLKQIFSNKGLNVDDLVALSGIKNIICILQSEQHNKSIYTVSVYTRL